MMLLYVCSQCGKWQDRTLTDALTKALSNFILTFSGKPLDAPTAVLCPDGHGPMTLVQASDKLFVWSAETEAALSGGLRLVEREETGDDQHETTR
jgi:hypothetical protein